MSLGGRAEGLLFQARITQSRAGRGLAAAEIVELFRRCRKIADLHLASLLAGYKRQRLVA
jgi:hypothetical protein